MFLLHVVLRWLTTCVAGCLRRVGSGAAPAPVPYIDWSKVQSKMYTESDIPVAKVMRAPIDVEVHAASRCANRGTAQPVALICMCPDMHDAPRLPYVAHCLLP